MNYEESLIFLEKPSWKGGFDGFDRFRTVLEYMGNPQNGMKYIHVTGSNGKGSTCAMIESVLRKAGYTTGLFTSPHLITYNERIAVNGEFISDEDFARGVTLVEEAMRAADVPLTFFERITALGFWYFRLKKCEYVVLEVGMGGHRSATNVIDMPEVAVIAHLALEHTSTLGNTIQEIAAEKSGILRENCDLVLMDQEKDALDTVLGIAEDLNVRVVITEPDKEKLVYSRLGLQVIDYRQRANVSVGLFGEYQFRNAALALDVIDMLKSRGVEIPEEAVCEGMRDVHWPGRFQVLKRDPLIILDGAHNPDGANVLKKSLDMYLPGRKFNFMMGVMADKEYGQMLDIIAPIANSFVCVSPDKDRGLGSEELRNLIETRYGVFAQSAASVEEGLELALEGQGDEVLVIFGSLYQAGDVLRYFRDMGMFE